MAARFPSDAYVPTLLWGGVEVGMRWGGLGGMALSFALASAKVQAADQRHFWIEASQHKVEKDRSVLAQVARRALPAVVSITTEQEASSDDATNGETSDPQQGLGSGFIIHPDGYILTSQHVIAGAKSISVKLSPGHTLPAEYPATVIGQDEATDTALLKISTKEKLLALPLASANDVQVADWIVVIGNPFGLSHSVSVGVISYKGRSDIFPNGRPGYFDFLQTDAAINPGNSGGPILDLRGEVVAVANAVNVSGQGIGFALPIDIAKQVLPQLKEDGRVRRSWMGVSVQDLNREVIDSYQLEVSRGVVVSEVVPEGPGDRAGLRVGDVITGIGGARVMRAHALRWEVATAGINRQVALEVLRNGEPLTVKVKLSELPEAEEPTGEAPAVGHAKQEAPAPKGSASSGSARDPSSKDH